MRGACAAAVDYKQYRGGSMLWRSEVGLARSLSRLAATCPRDRSATRAADSREVELWDLVSRLVALKAEAGDAG
jgi:hypothetical protein